MELTAANNYYQLLQRDLKKLKSMNTKLKEKITVHTNLSKSIPARIQDCKDLHVKHIEELNVQLLEDKDLQCPVCCEVFIKPVLLSCSHMFCIWCIENCSKENIHCPICRVPITHVVHCFTMNSFIEKKMKLMPASIRLERKSLEEARKEKIKIKPSHEEIFQFYLMYPNDASQSSNI